MRNGSVGSFRWPMALLEEVDLGMDQPENLDAAVG